MVHLNQSVFHLETFKPMYTLVNLGTFFPEMRGKGYLTSTLLFSIKEVVYRKAARANLKLSRWYCRI